MRGDVLVEVRHTAERMGLRNNPKRLPTGKMPEFVRSLPLDRLVERETTALPALVVALLGKSPGLAQAIEDLSFARPRIEPGIGQSPQLGVGAVVEAETLFAIEDRNGGRGLVERVCMRVD